MPGSVRLDQDDDPTASDSSIRLEQQEKLRGLISSPCTIPAEGRASNPASLRLQYASMFCCACVIMMAVVIQSSRAIVLYHASTDIVSDR